MAQAHYQVIAGIDEAGLGPILGPLTLGYAAFALPQPLSADALLAENLWQRTGGAIGRKPGERKQRPVVCDSKQIYNPSKGLKPLEEELLSWACLHGFNLSSFENFYASFCSLAREKRGAYDWYAATLAPFPLEAGPERAALRAEALSRALAQGGLALRELGAVPVFEGELNRLIGRTDNKSKAEFEVVGRVVGELWSRHRHLAVVCDRQGGREKYGRALKGQFPEADVSAFVESPKISSYELVVPGERNEPRLFIAFVEEGDNDHLPVALASMAAKYLREAMMHLFNNWFVARQPGLKRTAGYYQDGRRFLQDTADLRCRLGLDDARLIRAR